MNTQVNPFPKPLFDDLDLPIALRKSSQSYTQHPLAQFVSYGALNGSFGAFTTNLSRVSIPRDVHEALQLPKWLEAVNEEMKALFKNHTWEVIDLPIRKKPVRCKWVFTIKFKEDGSIERYKAKLVAKGYT